MRTPLSFCLRVPGAARNAPLALAPSAPDTRSGLSRDARAARFIDLSDYGCCAFGGRQHGQRCELRTPLRTPTLSHVAVTSVVQAYTMGRQDMHDARAGHAR
jgi:hypothetical protein